MLSVIFKSHEINKKLTFFNSMDNNKLPLLPPFHLYTKLSQSHFRFCYAPTVNDFSFSNYQFLSLSKLLMRSV